MIDPLLRLRHLRVFLETARRGSLSAAAEAMHVSQPAASKSIRELEEILGTALFDRTGRRLVLTAAGRVFQTRAGTAMADLAEAQRQVLDPPKTRPRLSLGLLPTASAELTPRAALAFRKAHPDCILRIATGPNWLLLSQLRERALDMVVGRMPTPENAEGLRFTQLYWERVLPVARAGHPLLTPDWSPGDLARYPLMLPPKGAMIASQVQAWLHSVGLDEPDTAFENVSAAFGRAVVLGSDTVWFISEGVVRSEIEAGTLAVLPLRHGLLGGPVGITIRDDHSPNAQMAALMAALEHAAEGMGA
ncbi:LysR family transcriptional regulator [Thioclava dalianensis]|uniref:LysR family transcriptional regulator n=1 Tax=Thioclava dalianensis TaxID=1185766 RepID=A0A074U8V5_9RHOB|nr:LysR substrate-binding domain-containing protein [Thioclava dalianensis]KEP71112.1 LysR family transcriptional regulator [Thioclava dalianensis]SFN24602.1 LysR family transcriptional regulator, pca operon transcriptional activator [Thioclava dalianensis]